MLGAGLNQAVTGRIAAETCKAPSTFSIARSPCRATSTSRSYGHSFRTRHDPPLLLARREPVILSLTRCGMGRGRPRRDVALAQGSLRSGEPESGLDRG